MKKLLLMLVLIQGMGAAAQSSCAESSFSLFHSDQWGYYTPQMYLKAHWKFKDDIQLVGSPTLQANPWFEMASFSTPNSSQVYSNDSLSFEFVLATDTAHTSYYPQEVVVVQHYISTHHSTDTQTLVFKGYVYFTPWRSTEFYDEFDFFAGERQWTLNPFDNPEPPKVFFSQSELPICNVPFADTITHEWEADYLLMPQAHAPFAIKQQMVHPDTMAWYCQNYADSASHYYLQRQQGNSLPPPPTIQQKKATHFQGTVSGRLFARMFNDHGDIQNVPLRGIQVRLLDKDGWFWEELDEVNTDENGNFTLVCDEKMSSLIEGNNLELYVQYKAKNKTYNFEIVRPTIDKLDWDIAGQAVFREENLGEHANNFALNLGDVFLGNQDQAFRTANFLWNSYRYCKNNVGIAAVEHDLTKYKLKVHINTGGSNFSALPKTYIIGGLYSYIDRPTIRLQQARIGHESTLYHEFGHYLMWCAGDHTFPKYWSEHSCGPNWSFHSLGQEQHLTIVYTEAWASFVGYVIDAANWQNDQEYMGRVWNEGNWRARNWSEFRAVSPEIENGLKGEDYIAKALYDMWDGPNQGLPELSNPNIAAILGDPDAHPFNDQSRTGGRIPGEAWSIPDECEISFHQMVKPVYDTRNDHTSDLNRYISHLLVNIGLVDCESKKKIGDCLRENRVLIDINGFENNAANSLDFNTSISTDDIFEDRPFSDFGKSSLCIGKNYKINVKQNPIEDEPFHVTNFPNDAWEPMQGLPNMNITDDMRLGFNFPNESSTFNINAGDQTVSTGVNMYTCGNVVWEFGNTQVNIGSPHSPYAHVHFNSGSEFIANTGSQIRIANNSSLIIEEGATLRIGPNTQIILDGPNAILEIRGNLVLEDGATFQPIGGANGQGFVRFNQPYVDAATAPTLVDVGEGSSMIFEAPNSATKVLEVASTDFWINDQGRDFNFVLRNARAEMAHNAMMNLGCRVTFDGALVEKLPSAGHYRGVVLWNMGYSQLIRNSTFKEASEAVHFVGSNGNSRLIAINNQFTNNYNGLRLTGGSFFLNSNTLNDNQGYGLVATGQQRTSTLFRSTVNNNLFKGIRYESNIGAALNLHTNDILQNTVGVKFISRGNLNMKCNQVHGIAGFGSPVGLEFYHGNLNMTQNLFNTGNNSFKNNHKSIHFPTAVGIEPKIELNNGWNRLSNKDANSPSSYNALEGMVDVSNAYKMAENNLWDLTPLNEPLFNYFPIFSNYGNYQTFFLTRMFSLNVKAPTTFDHMGIMLDQSEFSENWSTECSNNLRWKRSPGAEEGIFSEGEGTVVTSTSFNALPLSECIDYIWTSTADTLIANTTRIALWNELLTYDGFTEELDKTDEYYLSIAETQLFEVLGNYLFEMENEHPMGEHFDWMIDPVVHDVLEVCDFWDQKLMGETSVYGARFRNKINLSRGHLYHMIGENGAALEQFGHMQYWADTFALNESNYWICHINKLEQLNASGYDANLLYSLPECTFSEGSEMLYDQVHFKKSNKQKPTAIGLEERLNVFPNPTKDYFHISYFTDEEITVYITLLDVYGKEIKYYGSMDTYVGDNRGRLTTEGIQAGTYFVRLSANDKVAYKKLILID